jgi:hypothetical protein
MKVGLWKRTLLAGALSLLALWPVAGHASPSDSLGMTGAADPVYQFNTGAASCIGLGSGGLVGAGVASGGINRLAGLGSGGWYGPYYNPAYGSLGFGTYGSFMNFSGGQPSPFATLGGSPYCAGVPITGATATIGSTPCVIGGFSALGSGAFGVGTSALGIGGTPFGGFPFPPLGVTPFGSPLGAAGGVVCR